jgi:hypothetical protein
MAETVGVLHDAFFAQVPANPKKVFSDEGKGFCCGLNISRHSKG